MVDRRKFLFKNNYSGICQNTKWYLYYILIGLNCLLGYWAINGRLKRFWNSFSHPKLWVILIKHKSQMQSWIYTSSYNQQRSRSIKETLYPVLVDSVVPCLFLYPWQRTEVWIFGPHFITFYLRFIDFLSSIKQSFTHKSVHYISIDISKMVMSFLFLINIEYIVNENLLKIWSILKIHIIAKPSTFI